MQINWNHKQDWARKFPGAIKEDSEFIAVLGFVRFEKWRERETRGEKTGERRETYLIFAIAECA